MSGRIYSVRTAVEMLAKGNSGEVICGGTCRVADCGTMAGRSVEHLQDKPWNNLFDFC